MLLPAQRQWENEATCLMKRILWARSGTRRGVPRPWHPAGGSERLASPQCRSRYFVCDDYDVFRFINPLPVTLERYLGTSIVWAFCLAQCEKNRVWIREHPLYSFSSR